MGRNMRRIRKTSHPWVCYDEDEGVSTVLAAERLLCGVANVALGA